MVFVLEESDDVFSAHSGKVIFQKLVLLPFVMEAKYNGTQVHCSLG